MSLFPWPRGVSLIVWGLVRNVVDPGMPTWRDLRSLRERLVDHPTARAVPLLVVDISEPVLADPLPLPPCEEARADRIAVPPGKNVAEESHECFRLRVFSVRFSESGFRRAGSAMPAPVAGQLWPLAHGDVQRPHCPLCCAVLCAVSSPKRRKEPPR